MPHAGPPLAPRIPRTASAVRGSHDLGRGGRMFSAKFRSRDLPPTCPPLAPIILLRGGRTLMAKFRWADLPRATCPGLAPRWPPTCPHNLIQGRSDVYAQISVGGLALGALSRTCPTLAPHLAPACPQHAVWGLCSGVIYIYIYVYIYIHYREIIYIERGR